MHLQIDQSGKIEYTRVATVVAYSNGKQKSLWISAADKQKIQQFFRKAGKPNMYVFRTFAILMYLLMKEDLPQIQSIIIDREYVGREDLIKKYLLELIRRGGHDIDPLDIHFSQIGKSSPAHKKAINTFRKDKKPDLIITYNSILEWML